MELSASGLIFLGLSVRLIGHHDVCHYARPFLLQTMPIPLRPPCTCSHIHAHDTCTYIHTHELRYAPSSHLNHTQFKFHLLLSWAFPSHPDGLLVRTSMAAPHNIALQFPSHVWVACSSVLFLCLHRHS